MFALVWFRDKPDIPMLGKGFGLSQATLNEVIDVLAAQAPDLHRALERAKADGLAHLILDGKIIDTDRVREKTTSQKGREIDLWYAGKIHDIGGNIQAIFAPNGLPLWVSDVLPGNVQDLKAARRLVPEIIRPYLNHMPLLADPGYQGAGHGIFTPVKQPADGSELDTDTRTYNALLAALPGRTWLRSAVPALANPPARHAQPQQDR